MKTPTRLVTSPFVIRHSTFVLAALLAAASATGSVGEALKNYQRGKYSKAREEYERLAKKNPDDTRLRFNAGAAAFQDEDYKEALRHFSAGLSAPDVKLQQRSYYNLGNTQFRLGEQAQEMKEKQQAWEQAIHDFENALKLGANDMDAKFNLEVVKQKLEELKQQQQQQQQDQQKSDDKKDENKDDQQKQDQQKQDQQKQDQQKQDKEDGRDQKKDEQQQSDQQKKDEQSKQDQKQDQQRQENQDQSSQRQAQDQRGQEPDEKSQAAQYSKVMQMTPQQAVQLLEAQKAGEKAMIFVPQSARTNRNPNRVLKDW
jgi:Ca-activated chloride channel family protein